MAITYSLASKYAYGIKGISYGTPTGAATMPGSLTPWVKTVKGSLTITEDEATVYEPRVEEKAAPVKVIVTETGSLIARWRVYDLTPTEIKKFRGGETSGADDETYEAPSDIKGISLALGIECEEDVKFNIFKAAISTRIDGNISRDSLLEMEVTATAVSPGDGLAAWQYVLPVDSKEED